MSKLQQALQGVQGPSISTRQLQQKQYQQASIQAAPVQQTDYNSQLMGIASGGTELYAGYQKMREAEGQKRKDEIMQKNMTPEEMRKLREEGIMLYQDDIYAMRALDRELGRSEAYSKEAVIQERIASGQYTTREDMEKDRASLLGEAQKAGFSNYGIKQGETGWFDEGFQADIADRSFAAYNAVDVKVDQYKRNEGILTAQSNVSDFIRSGQPEHVMPYLQGQLKAGVIRTEGDMIKIAEASFSELAQQPASVDAIRVLSNEPVTLNGVETTWRKYLGEERFRQLENVSASSTLNNNWKSQQWVMEKGYTLSNPDFSTNGYETGMQNLKELEDFANQTQGDAGTQLRHQVQGWKEQFHNKYKAYNDKTRADIGESQQQKVRLSYIDMRINDALEGSTESLKMSTFPTDDSTGQYTPADWNAFYEMRTGRIDADQTLSDDEKALKKLQLGVLLKDNKDTGFGAHYERLFEMAGTEMGKYRAAIKDGAEVSQIETPVMDQLMAMHKASPELFAATLGPDFPMATDIKIAATMGIGADAMFVGRERLKNIRDNPDVNRQLSTELANLETKKGMELYAHLSPEERDNVQALYMALDGFDNETKVQYIKKHIDSQYVKPSALSAAIPRSMLMLNPNDPKSVAAGEARFIENLKRSHPGTDLSRLPMTVIGDRVRVLDLVNGYKVYTKDMMLAEPLSQ